MQVGHSSIVPASPFSAPPNLREMRSAQAEWGRVAGALADPAVELDSDTFADLLQTFRRLQRSGVVVDAGLAGLMSALTRQVTDTAADSDSDFEEDDHVGGDGWPGDPDDGEEAVGSPALSGEWGER